MNISLSIFADDTTIIGKKGEIDTGVEEVKNIMAKFEEKNNDDKEETLNFGAKEGKKIRMLGCLTVAEINLKNRIRRGGAL